LRFRVNLGISTESEHEVAFQLTPIGRTSSLDHQSVRLTLLNTFIQNCEVRDAFGIRPHERLRCIAETSNLGKSGRVIAPNLQDDDLLERLDNARDGLIDGLQHIDFVCHLYLLDLLYTVHLSKRKYPQDIPFKFVNSAPGPWFVIATTPTN
jgi:hypothetical protein